MHTISAKQLLHQCGDDLNCILRRIIEEIKYDYPNGFAVWKACVSPRVDPKDTLILSLRKAKSQIYILDNWRMIGQFISLASTYVYVLGADGTFSTYFVNGGEPRLLMSTKFEIPQNSDTHVTEQRQEQTETSFLTSQEIQVQEQDNNGPMSEIQVSKQEQSQSETMVNSAPGANTFSTSETNTITHVTEEQISWESLKEYTVFNGERFKTYEVSPDKIDKLISEILPRPCVYKLICDDIVLYVGQSVNCRERIRRHLVMSAPASNSFKERLARALGVDLETMTKLLRRLVTRIEIRYLSDREITEIITQKLKEMEKEEISKSKPLFNEH